MEVAAGVEGENRALHEKRLLMVGGDRRPLCVQRGAGNVRRDRPGHQPARECGAELVHALPALFGGFAQPAFDDLPKRRIDADGGQRRGFSADESAKCLREGRLENGNVPERVS